MRCSLQVRLIAAKALYKDSHQHFMKAEQFVWQLQQSASLRHPRALAALGWLYVHPIGDAVRFNLQRAKECFTLGVTLGDAAALVFAWYFAEHSSRIYLDFPSPVRDALARFHALSSPPVSSDAAAATAVTVQAAAPAACNELRLVVPAPQIECSGNRNSSNSVMARLAADAVTDAWAAHALALTYHLGIPEIGLQPNDSAAVLVWQSWAERNFPVALHWVGLLLASRRVSAGLLLTRELTRNETSGPPPPQQQQQQMAPSPQVRP